jgi:hypothetical protein
MIYTLAAIFAWIILVSISLVGMIGYSRGSWIIEAHQEIKSLDVTNRKRKSDAMRKYIISETKRNNENFDDTLNGGPLFIPTSCPFGSQTFR